MKKNLNYNDIFLIPKYSEIKSRDNISTDTEFLGRIFNSPVIPANMKCTISFKLAEELSETGYFYILHRFYDYHDIYKWIKDNQKLQTISISIGVKAGDRALISSLRNEKLGVDFITIDVASGHNILVKEMTQYIKDNFIRSTVGQYCKIIAGNIMTPQAVWDYKEWGIDAAKVGLSQGRGCSTYNTTGVGGLMFSSIQNCARANALPIIADGGIKEIGDISKSLVGGANMVMIGSLFSACDDSPAEFYRDAVIGAEFEKIYYGSASKKNKGHNKYVEGREEILIPRNYMTYLEFLDKINQGIRSCMSYNGSKNIKDLINMKYGIK